MRRIVLVRTAVAATLLTGASLTACGGSTSSSTTTSAAVVSTAAAPAPASTTTAATAPAATTATAPAPTKMVPAAMTKSAYIQQVDAVCGTINKDLAKLVTQSDAAQKRAGTTDAEQLAAVAPFLRRIHMSSENALDRIRAIPTPPGGRETRRERTSTL